MKWFARVLRSAGLLRSPSEIESRMEKERERTGSTISTALVFAAQARDSSLGVMDHSAQVSFVAERIAQELGLSEADQYTLILAARLHELGMFGIPPEMLLRPSPLSSEELRQVRAQARISAEVARLVHPPRVAHLIEHQYMDHRQLAMGKEASDQDLLLAGILRVADVFAAVTWPRPYQDPMPSEFRDELLQRGSGIQFHPLAVNSARGLQASI